MKNNRADMSHLLFHWCKNPTQNYDEAFNNLLSIIIEQQIRGSSNLIRSGDTVICFTEAPISVVSDNSHGDYLPFGIAISKEILFSNGGRHVIYQTEDEYSILPDEIRWRHMKYNPVEEGFCDFSWEREWRIQADSIPLCDYDINIIVPDETWEKKLLAQHLDIRLQESYEWFMCVGYGAEPETIKHLIIPAK